MPAMNEIFLLFPILIPLAGGLGIWLLRGVSRTFRNIFTELVVIINAVMVFVLICCRPQGELLILRFTDIMPIKLRLDGLGSFFAGMTAFLWIFVTIYAFAYMKDEHHERMFFTFFTVTFAATQGICMAGNLITMYFFYEMLTLVTIPLVLHGCRKRDMHAARVYAAYQLGGAAFAFVGIVVLTVACGGCDFILGGNMPDGSQADTVMQIIYLFMLLGFGVKACVFPFYRWLPIASVAPTPVTALLHSVAVVKAGIFAIMRMTYYNFGADFLYGTTVQYVGLSLVIFTAVFAAVLAVRERHFKRRLAYSTVSNLSYILTGVLLMTEAGFAAGLCHMIFHAVMKLNSFLCAGAFIKQTGRAYIYEIDGIGKKMPVTFACYTVSALALTGIPPLCGFVSKWQLVSACVDAKTTLAYIGGVGLIAAALLTAIYMLSVSVRAFFPRSDRILSDDSGIREAPALMLIPMILFAFLCVALGIASAPVTELCRNIVGGLI